MGVNFISEVIDFKDEERIRLGMMSSHRWRVDPRALLFSMARHKFVAKMFDGRAEVIDAGCGDGWGAQMVRQNVGAIRAYDVDPLLVAECQANIKLPNLTFDLWDFSKAPTTKQAEAAYSLDVLEHVAPEDEAAFLSNIAASLVDDGSYIVGIPSLCSQAYASESSKRSHVNCKNGPELRETLKKHFRQVFMFSMNDEVVHTGYFPMSHYLIGLGVGPKRP